jgi:hypothetical protein
MEVTGQLHAPTTLPLEVESPCTHLLGGWVALKPVWTL